MFLGVTASVTNWDVEGTCCSIVLEDNPLVDFVEVPVTCQGLYYCNVLTGVIRGALEMVSMITITAVLCNNKCTRSLALCGCTAIGARYGLWKLLNPNPLGDFHQLL